MTELKWLVLIGCVFIFGFIPAIMGIDPPKNKLGKITFFLIPILLILRDWKEPAHNMQQHMIC